MKGSSYLEALAKVDTVAFDKTGTLTSGTFGVVAVHAHGGVDKELLLSYAAHAEAYSNHPIALSVVDSYSGVIDHDRIGNVQEISGAGVTAVVDEHRVFVGNDKLMSAEDIDFHNCKLVGTILHVAVDGEYLGHIIIADMMKDDAKEAIDGLHAAGVKKTVMLTGDRKEVADAVGAELGVDEIRSQLMPQDKVAAIELLLSEHEGANGNVAFVGDGRDAAARGLDAEGIGPAAPHELLACRRAVHPISTVARPAAMGSGGPASTTWSPCRAAGSPPIRTVALPTETTPPTCGLGPSDSGQTWKSAPARHAGMPPISTVGHPGPGERGLP